MRIDFYHWGSMCPISDEIIQRLKGHKNAFDICVHDFTNNFDLAKKEKIFFPFLTVVNGEKRYYDPISEAFLQTLQSGNMPVETPYKPVLGRIEKRVEIQKIVGSNYHLASQCTGRQQCLGCERKPKLYSTLPDRVIGFMNVKGEELLGGAEYYPSLCVPYDIPKGIETAFITCVYRSDEQFDYKTAPLKALEKYLARRYKQVVVISDEEGTFPNGNLDFFERNGYRDERVVFEDEYCRLHLLSKGLSV